MLNSLRKNDCCIEKSYYNFMFEVNHSMMLLIDPETGRIIDANSSASSFYGYSTEELKRMKISDINALSKEEIFYEMQNAKLQKRNHFYFPHRLANGEIRQVEVYSGPIIRKGKKLLYSLIHDITERKKAEDKIIILNSILSSVSKINQMMVRETDQTLLFQKTLDILIETRRYHIAWIGKLCKKSIIQMAIAGTIVDDCDIYLDDILLEKVIKDRKTIVKEDDLRKNCNNIIIPIICEDQIFGILNMYSFNDVLNEEIKLLEDLVGSIGLVIEKYRVVEQLKESVIKDYLTGLYNRQGFMEFAQKQLAHSKREGKVFGVLMMDLDNFKNINDFYGHLAGDQVLIKFANILTSIVRETDVVCRLGGDEFAAIIKADLKELQLICKRIKTELQNWSRNDQIVKNLGISIGIALWGPDHSDDIENLLKNADQKMYLEKMEHKNE